MGALYYTKSTKSETVLLTQDCATNISLSRLVRQSRTTGSRPTFYGKALYNTHPIRQKALEEVGSSTSMEIKPRPLVFIFTFLLPLCFSSILPIDETNQGNKARVAYALAKEVRKNRQIASFISKIVQNKVILTNYLIFTEFKPWSM